MCLCSRCHMYEVHGKRLGAFNTSPHPDSNPDQTSTKPNEDIDFSAYLVGTWKRDLEWRNFGGVFDYVRSSNTLVVVEETDTAQAESGVRHLKWSIGRHLHKSELRFGYEMKVTSHPKTNEVLLEWVYQNTLCKGKYCSAVQVATLNFTLPNCVVTATYRVVDANTMAVCIVEVGEAQLPTIQCGTMYRIDPTQYI